MACLLSVLFVLLINYNPVISKCDLNYNQNLRNISRNDVFGGVINVVHKYYVSVARAIMPDWPRMCKTGFLKFGDIKIKTSLRPRGCCVTCCLIDEADDYIQIHLMKKNAKFIPIKLSDEKKAGNLRNIGIDEKVPTILYLHGFGEDGATSESAQIITDAYMSTNGTYNILRVDWSELGTMPWYMEAKDNVRIMAVALTNFLKFYHETGELPIQNLHIIGISIGAQIGGLIGKMIGNVEKVPRITGLDPAYPLYSEHDTNERISQSDANFVDIIHTSPGVFGFPISIGHADFYPNYKKGGQPGCDLLKYTRMGGIFEYFMCDHLRSVELYAESVVNPTAFPVVEMNSGSRKARVSNNDGDDNKSFMGFSADKSTTMGDFILTTNNKKPYRSIQNEET